jgi:nitronate monooxygenase
MPTNPSPFIIKGKTLLPIVQGGMGVGVSAHRLAGSVAALGAMGTISSVDLRRHHADLMAATEDTRNKDAINAANLIALDREIRAAIKLSDGRGLVAVNVMRAVGEYVAYVRQACESGAGALVVGAGLPLDLPDLTAGFPDVALIPILSDARGVGLIIRKWMRKNRLPDAIIIENPQFAGGHLGATSLNDLDAPYYAFAQVLAETQDMFAKLGIAPIPLILAGGIHDPSHIRALFRLGASAVQLGTAFAVTAEGDAHPEFKRVLAEAGPEDIVTFMSVAGLPARAVKTPWLARYLEKQDRLQALAKTRLCTMGFDCLQQCGLRDGNSKAGQFCIDLHLGFALAGDVKRGLFFRGAEKLPFGRQIRPVRDLIEYLLGMTGQMPLREAG